jgi:hypothetical protein
MRLLKFLFFYQKIFTNTAENMRATNTPKSREIQHPICATKQRTGAMDKYAELIVLLCV